MKEGRILIEPALPVSSIDSLAGSGVTLYTFLPYLLYVHYYHLKSEMKILI